MRPTINCSRASRLHTRTLSAAFIGACSFPLLQAEAFHLYGSTSSTAWNKRLPYFRRYSNRGPALSAMATAQPEGPRFIIDSHLHVWGDGKSPFPYAEGQDPPERLQSSSNPSVLLSEMDNAGVGGALIVQPINYKFDHSYVLDVMKKYPGRFKGMCLANPSLDPQEACAELERLHDEGFCGVRFNPYLWKEGDAGMKDETGLAMYKRAGELDMPVGAMCFKGLGLHLEDIKALLDSSSRTKLIIDHFGFYLQGGDEDEGAWQNLLALAKYPQAYVKVSAFFRVSKDPYPYPGLKPRFQALLSAFGSKRLLWGSDFPFVADGQCGYRSAKQAVCEDMGLTEDQLNDVVGATAETLFGSWSDA